MHSSFFSYNLQRDYPYRWFTPVAVAGGIIFTIFFSIVSFAANGYQLKTSYVTNPNDTLSRTHWYDKAPWSWTSKIAATCEAQNLQPGTTFFTSNLGLTYTLTGVRNHNTTFPALVYMNNPLEDCYVDFVDVEMRRSSRSDRIPTFWWVFGASYATASVHCTIATDAGFVNATFTVPYTDLGRTYTYVLEADPAKSASIWWGTRLVNAYWQGCLWAMAATKWTEQRTPYSFQWDNDDRQWDLASFRFTVEDVSSIQSMGMFSLVYHLVAQSGDITNIQIPRDSNFSEADWYNNETLPLSAIMTEAQGFAKAFYSLILVDLGQSSLSNLLLSENDLQYVLQAKSDLFRSQNTSWLPQYDAYGCMFTQASSSETATYQNENCNNFNRLQAPNDTEVDMTSDAAFATPRYRMDRAYDIFKDQMGALGTSNATIYSQYACSMPVPRSKTTLGIAIILADLVFLSTVWTLYKLVVDWRLRKRDANADACPKCLEHSGIPLEPLGEFSTAYVGRPLLSRGITGESSFGLLR
jgi:hypothetical protein